MVSVEVEVSKLGARGQVTIPKSIREREDLKPGDYVAIIEEDGELSIVKLDVEAWARRVKEIEEERGTAAPSMDEIVEMVDEVRETA